MIYHITCNTDNNYAQHCAAMLCSLFENNRDLKCCVHILTNNLAKHIQTYLLELSKKYDNEIVFHIVDESQLQDLQYRERRPLTKAAYYRILLPSIISSDIEKILYLDCDMIVLKSIKELFDVDLNGYALAATCDTAPYSDVHRRQLSFDLGTRAFCSGIMMINLKFWRECYAQDKLIEFSKKKREPVYLHDQDALNYVFRNKWFILPPKYNHTTMSISPLTKFNYDNTEYTFDPIIWHFSSDLKPWFNISFPGRQYYLKYLNKSGFPNPQFDDKGFKYKVLSYFKVSRYYISRYLYPIMPRILEILLYDLYVIIKLLVTLLHSPTKANEFIVNTWENKKRSH